MQSTSTIKFDSDYFANNMIRLRDLRFYLRNHTDFRTDCYDHCRLLRKNGLKMETKLTYSEDMSLGEYIHSFGGVTQFLETPVYKISIAAAAIIYAHILKKAKSDIIRMTPQRGVEIINTLLNTQVTQSSNLVRTIIDMYQRPDEEILAAIEISHKELPQPLPAPMLDELTQTLRSHLYQSCRRASETASPSFQRSTFKRTSFRRSSLRRF